MYDIHCHILPGVDDGPSNFNEAMEMACIAAKAGIKGIVCTPHYNTDIYISSSDNNSDMLNRLKTAVEQAGIGIKLFLGNEIYMAPNIIDLLDTSKISTLNNSRYILLEMPVYSKPIFIDETIYKLKLRGLVPVIAHPERYEWVIKNPKEISSIINKGCLTQLSIASLGGLYGERVRKAAKVLITEHCIHLLGSDSHFSKTIYNQYSTYMKQLQKITPEDRVRQMIQNTEAVIYDQVIKSN